MLMYIEGDPEEMSTFLKEFAHILTHTPVPPAGTVSVVGHCYLNKPSVKFLNFGTPEIFAVIYLKFKQRGQTSGYFVKMMQME